MNRVYEQQFGLFRTLQKGKPPERIYQDLLSGEWIREPLTPPQSVDGEQYRKDYSDIQNTA